MRIGIPIIMINDYTSAAISERKEKKKQNDIANHIAKDLQSLQSPHPRDKR